MIVTEGALGPVQTEEGFTPCLFTGKLGDVAVEGVYDPSQTHRDLGGRINTVITVAGLTYDATLGPIGPNGLCGTAEPT